MQIGQVEFAFDAAKSAANRHKHGIDFEAAQGLWSDPNLIVLPSKYPAEARFLAIGQLGEQHWTAIYTERGDTIRLISVRRSRDSEKELYEQDQP